MIGQRKAFYRQRIPGSSSVRKETIDIEILAASRNGDRKSMQSIRITSRPPTKIRKWNQLIQFRWTSTKVILIFLKLGFTPCKAEKPLQGIKLQEKEGQKH